MAFLFALLNVIIHFIQADGSENLSVCSFLLIATIFHRSKVSLCVNAFVFVNGNKITEKAV